MKKTALITGASGGIGYGLAKVFASHGYDLVIVARDKEKLQALADELPNAISVHILAKDLSMPESCVEIYDYMAKHSLSIDVLVNNAGFGDFGLFAENDWTKQEAMIQVNMLALTHLTRLFLPDMIKRKHGKVLNVASTAAFQPGPLMAVYYATKAYVLSYSEAIANELEGTGVTVTCLCPGPTASGFQKAAALDGSKLFEGRQLPTAQEVAEFGYRALEAKRTVAVHGLQNYLGTQIVRLLPRSWVLWTVRRAQERR